MKKLFFVFAFLIPLITYAQTIKTDVLILGSSNAAFAAGIQATESGVNAIILTQSDGFKLSDFKSLPQSGVTKAFEKRARKSLKLADSLPLPEITNQILNAVIKNWSDSSKLLDVINNTIYYEIKRSGSGWEAKLTKEKSIKAKVLIVTDNIEKILPTLKVESLKPAETNTLTYTENLYRTTIGGINGTSNYLPLYNLLVPNHENILYIKADNLEIGQAAGATAAYAAFFQTKTSLSNLKRIQGELLSYKLSLMPFEDVKIVDSNWLAIQKVGITGILKADIKDGKVYFNPEKEVTYDEVKQPIKDYYYKAQIWFDDHQNIPINLENTISMVCYVGNKAVDVTKNEIEKKWKKNYKFSSKYDLKKILTRREFSVIINEYLKPFDLINVDRTGRVIR
ncbi:hypothetical protein EZ449_05735 [Pedobacter frigidisoli]|uniref:FAD dependent oxidoreductase n=1 Tax=Pedobacter frigidisoli TaxID=2530455 RepID=A0A4R0PA77_9SPHI|nr:hypothetical protein [Pedobacter frigidisoli]TCD11757.1 hypothetical protein EZ449_05735 [Pedobacter frigidisoli]